MDNRHIVIVDGVCNSCNGAAASRHKHACARTELNNKS